MLCDCGLGVIQQYNIYSKTATFFEKSGKNTQLGLAVALATWYNGTQTEYAEITYSTSGKEDETLKYDTTKGDIIYIKNNEKEYNLSVCYYDSKGNRYE